MLSRDKTVARLVPEGLGASPIGAKDWETAVGSRIAARTRPERLEQGTLHVVTASAAWSQELSLLVDPIRERLGVLGIQVENLRFRVGKIDMTSRIALRRPVKDAPPDAPLSEPLARALASVEDDELRRSIARAAKKALGFDLPLHKKRP
ncbi:MAG: DUF721 domain-containing protein [Polyangiaceae bacterium]|nr:DUF721 domain-containing protein [Polyangiaceae bacterium]